MYVVDKTVKEPFQSTVKGNMEECFENQTQNTQVNQRLLFCTEAVYVLEPSL